MRLLRPTHQGGDTRDGYDRPPPPLRACLLHHLFRGGLDGVESAGEVGVGVELEQGRFNAEEFFEFADARVGDEDVEAGGRCLLFSGLGLSRWRAGRCRRARR